MKTGAQVGRTDDGDIEAGFQIMFSKRKVKKYSVATSSIPSVSVPSTVVPSEGIS